MSKKLVAINDKERELIDIALEAVAKEFDAAGGVQSFINEFMTEGERLTISRRILISQLLLAGYTRMEVINALHVSPNTIAQVRKWLMSEVKDYDEIVKSARSNIADRTAKHTPYASFDPLTFAGLKKRYPMHFLLFTIADEIISKMNQSKS